MANTPTFQVDPSVLETSRINAFRVLETSKTRSCPKKTVPFKMAGIRKKIRKTIRLFTYLYGFIRPLYGLEFTPLSNT